MNDIVRRLPPEIMTVGVFRDEVPERVIEIVQKTGLRAAQLHGHESPEQTHEIKKRVPVVFKAFAAGDLAVRQARAYRADAVLVDNPKPGSGQVFDWSLAEDVPGGLRLMLAGGLDADNVADAIHTVHPWGVDACSGLEASPGKKDPRKLRAFIANAKEAGGDDDDDEAPLPDGPAPFDWMEHGG
ncbi:MAG: phosphoribosylanthranilate isomerase [Actinomycetia bacterium]|nr:phosphoribosylanthranilate isomerase [Actinomycetes bacterium]